MTCPLKIILLKNGRQDVVAMDFNVNYCISKKQTV